YSLTVVDSFSVLKMERAESPKRGFLKSPVYLLAALPICRAWRHPGPRELRRPGSEALTDPRDRSSSRQRTEQEPDCLRPPRSCRKTVASGRAFLTVQDAVEAPALVGKQVYP